MHVARYMPQGSIQHAPENPPLAHDIGISIGTMQAQVQKKEMRPCLRVVAAHHFNTLPHITVEASTLPRPS